MSINELDAILRRAQDDARASERRRIGLWLEHQAVVARDAPSGVHPQAGTRTHASVLMWSAARVLSGDIP